MAKLFLSYRRSDAPDSAGRLDDRLVSEFGRRQVFKDVDSIPAGADFRQKLHDAVTSCDVLLVLIGPRWIAASDNSGQKRLFKNTDFVRAEIEIAIESGVPLIPVLLGNAMMPEEHELPESISRLAFHNAVQIRPDPDFHQDADRLIRAIASTDQTPTIDAVPAQADAVPAKADDRSDQPMSIDSPRSRFHCGPWVPADYFIGREEQLCEARELIRARQSFLIIGHPRAGKTSFCRKLEDEFHADAESSVLVSYLNLQQCSDLNLETFMEHTILNIAGEIARSVFGCRYMDLRKASPAETYPELQNDSVFDSFVEIFRHISDRTHATPESVRTLGTQEFVHLTRDLLDIAREKGRQGFVIFYDEANRLPVDISGDVLLGLAETLNDTGVNGGYVASPAMEDQFESIDQLFGARILVGPFPSIEMMKKLLARYYFGDAEAADNLPIGDEALQLMWTHSGGVPFRIQLIGDYTFRVARRRGSATIDAGVVDEAYQIARQERPAAFRAE